MNERSKQEVDLKPQKLKTLPKDLIVDKHIENFEELKKSDKSIFLFNALSPNDKNINYRNKYKGIGCFDHRGQMT